MLAASLAAAAAPQYRTHNDRLAPPRFATAEAWAPRAQYLREHVLASAGLMPMPERTPLRPVVFDEVAHADYTVSKVYFESLPGSSSPAISTGRSAPARFRPILSPHGHWTYGRLENTALNSGPGRAIGLARQGFVVFTHDMVGYGDSRQLPHTFGGRRESLWGLSLGGLQLWNGIRALDFLETLPYVRRDGFGVTGESGGGTQTFLLGAVDPRVAVAVPVNMISLHMQGGCLCENMPGLRLDTNNVEIAATIAPRPLLMVSATGDWTKETLEVEYPAMRSLYALLGAGSKVHAVRFTAEHNYNKDSREAMYAWMARWLQQRARGREAAGAIVQRRQDHGPAGVLQPRAAGRRGDGRATDGSLDRGGEGAARGRPIAAGRSRPRCATRSASAPSRPPAAPCPRSRRAATASSPAHSPTSKRAAQGRLRRPRRRRSRRSTPPRPAKVQHFDTYNRTAASQRVADIVAALRESPSAVLVADGDAALPALLAAAIVPVRQAIVERRRLRHLERRAVPRSRLHPGPAAGRRLPDRRGDGARRGDRPRRRRRLPRRGHAGRARRTDAASDRRAGDEVRQKTEGNA